MSIFVRIAPERYEADAFEDFVAVPEFRTGNARALMWLAQAAYQLKDFKNFESQRLFAAWGLESATPWVVKDLAVHTSGFHAFRGDACFLVFAGTDPTRWETVVTDALALQPARADIHYGFLRAFEAVADDVLTFLDQVQGRKLYVVGHSLGAAIAILAARFAARNGVKPCAVYAFGAPRVGGKAFAQDYNEALGDVTYRLVYGDDLAARLPMSTVALGRRTIHYRHVGRLLSCAAGAAFDAASLSGDPSSNDPPCPSARQFFSSNWTKLLRGPRYPDPGFYSGAKRVFNKLRPASFRHHMQDQYLHALRPEHARVVLNPDKPVRRGRVRRGSR